MKTFFDSHGSIEGLQKLLSDMSHQPGVAALLVLCADGNDFSPAELDSVLQSQQLPLIGGIFPALIHSRRIHYKGTIVVGLPDAVSIRTVTGLSDSDVDYEKALENMIADSSKVRTLILFVDGFATRLASFVESLFNVFGLEFNYVGGGAGSLSMERKKYILTNEGALPDAACLAFLQINSGVGVCHGWRELAGPYQITKSEGNTIHSIEWQPALEFYRKVIEEKAGARLEKDRFFATAQNFPFGIARLDGEQIVRDPYSVDDAGSIICVGEIQEGTFISILRAEEQHLVQAASESLQLSLQAFPKPEDPGLAFFVDCISRVIVLGENYTKEIDAVQTDACPLIGVCSIGEIANCGTEFLELYNKTSVMAVLEEK